MRSFWWRTCVQGTFAVLPACVTVIVSTRTIAPTLTCVESIAAALPFAAVLPGLWVIAWAMVVLVLACFTVGLVLDWPPARRLVAAAGDSLVKRYPIHGPVYILVRERVHRIDASARQVIDCVLRWGVGAGGLIKSMRQAA